MIGINISISILNKTLHLNNNLNKIWQTNKFDVA